MKKHLVTHSVGSIKQIVIALHGFGDNGENFAHLAKAVHLEGVLWIFLEAPQSIPGFPQGFQWFSLYSNPLDAVRASCGLIEEALSEALQRTGLSYKDTFLLGFSQGAAMALYCAIKTGYPYAGVLFLSGFCVCQSELHPLLLGLKHKIPIFLSHGRSDSVVFPTFFFEAKNFLALNPCVSITSTVYGAGHELTQPMLEDIKTFIEEHQS